MKIEQELFKRSNINFEKLKAYGFIKKENTYQYSKIIMDEFKVDITIDKTGKVIGKIYDLSFGEEYTNFRIESQTGEFVNQIKEEYKKILNDIINHCCEKKYFITDQANRITKRINDRYHDEPEFAWESSPGFGIFRNTDTKKWYALIMNIDKSKLDKNCSGEIEAINLKIDSNKIPSLLNKKGIYPAYHMNKKHWITIILDNTLQDEEIIEYIKESHSFTRH